MIKYVTTNHRADMLNGIKSKLNLSVGNNIVNATIHPNTPPDAPIVRLEKTDFIYCPFSRANKVCPTIVVVESIGNGVPKLIVYYHHI